MSSVVNILCVREVFCLPIPQVWRKASVPEIVFTLLYTRGVSAFPVCPKPTCNPGPRTATLLQDGDKYCHCTAPQKGGGLGQGNLFVLHRALTELFWSLGARMWSPLLNAARQSNPAAAEVWDTRMLHCECAVWWGFITWLKLKPRIVTLDKPSLGRITSEIGNPRMKSLLNQY